MHAQQRSHKRDEQLSRPGGRVWELDTCAVGEVRRELTAAFLELALLRRLLADDVFEGCVYVLG